MKENEDKLKEISKQRKYEYQINRNIALGHLKNHIIELFENNSPDDILTKLNALFLQNIEPIRNGRKYPRKSKSKRKKRRFNTSTNYKRAI